MTNSISQCSDRLSETEKEVVELLVALLQHRHHRAAPLAAQLAGPPLLTGQDGLPPLVPRPVPIQWS